MRYVLNRQRGQQNSRRKKCTQHDQADTVNWATTSDVARTVRDACLRQSRCQAQTCAACGAAWGVRRPAAGGWRGGHAATRGGRVGGGPPVLPRQRHRLVPQVGLREDTHCLHVSYQALVLRVVRRELRRHTALQ